MRFSELPDTPFLHGLFPNKWFLYVSRHAYLLAVPLLLPGAVWLTKDSKFDNHLGSLSYPLYLLHPIFLALNITASHVAGIPTPIFVVIASVLLSILTAMMIERPIDRFRQWRVRQKKLMPFPVREKSTLPI